ncbi:exo-alpha-sialidase [Prosthecobacter sp.]|uniref:exo-alpha-sialidase n=1 Tax=Prosthecobacter sp. TaxID=1965333 RepID=UPI002489F651|nr:exo-alpha-sialidase [Prosthecobacter sp.]MDI1315028.1 exo-alpha-sialidase [Prosthecobacter sp.]
MKFLSPLLLLSAATAFAADSPKLHPKAAALPFTHQGPFVTAADGGVLCIDAKNVLRTVDEGRTWSSAALFAEPAKFSVSSERAVLRTREGVIISAWMNSAERKEPKGWHWGEPGVDWKAFVLPTYSCRSTDDGKTWEPPVKLSTPWCGCIHSMIQMKSGRIVLVGQEIIPQWRHATVMWVSDDLGKSWQRGDVLDYGVGTHDHAGSLEGTVIERKDGSLYLLLRTESGFLWEATSRDGLKWTGLQTTKIASVTCCPQLARLSDGRIALLWNAPPRHDPKNSSSRVELSLAFSDDETATWSKPVIVAANYATGSRVSYPYLYERKPGELWITTMQGGLRMKVHTADLGAGEIPVFVPPPKAEPKPGSIIMFGDSTTAPRGSLKVYATRVETTLQGVGSTLGVINAGIGGNTTRDGLKRLQNDVLKYKPRVVVMQFGINDSAVDVWKNPPATAPRVPLAEYLANIRCMVTAAQDVQAKVILMTTNPLRWTPKLKDVYGKPPYDPAAEDGFDSATLAGYNEALRKLAAELKVPLVDVRAAYPDFAAKHQTTIEGMLLDGMHPNDLGQELVAELLVPAIRATLR